MDSLLSVDLIERRIYFLRGQKVMLDADLAEVYGTSTKRLNQQFLRNRERFPEDFAFQLNANEATALRLRNATSKNTRGGRRYLPYAFTEHGAVMLSSVLKTPAAIEASIMIARAFISLRQMISVHKALAIKLEELESEVSGHGVQIRGILNAIKRLMNPRKAPIRKIGFQP